MPPNGDVEGGKGGGPGALIEEYAPWSYAVLAGVGIAIVWFLFVRGRGGGSGTSGGVLPSGQVSTGQSGDATVAAVQSLHQRIAEEREERQKSEQRLLATVQGWMETFSRGVAQAFGQMTGQIADLGKALQTGLQQEAQSRTQMQAEMQSQWQRTLQDLLAEISQTFGQTIQTQQQTLSSLQQQIGTLTQSIAKLSEKTGDVARQVEQVASTATRAYVTPAGSVLYDPSTGVGVRQGVAIVSSETPYTQPSRYGRDPVTGQVVDIPTGTQVGTREHSIATGLIPGSTDWYNAMRAAGLIK
jgi:ElaB/YqjD/DUF883 family membrane-anchored ribosome-binding protein